MLFSVIIDDVFFQVRPDIGRSLFADDGEKYSPYGRESSRSKVDQCSLRWGFKVSVEKTHTVLFSRRKVGNMPEVVWKESFFSNQIKVYLSHTHG